MADKAMQKFKTSDYVPVLEAELRWVFIDAPGKPAMDEDKPNRKQCSIYVETESDGCQALIEAIKKFWDDNKGKGWKAKSLGYKEEVALKEGIDVDDEDFDADDEDNYEKTGKTIFSFWTLACWKDGKDNVIGIYNAKGSKVSLGGKKIGNGTLGSVSGTMGIYENGTGKKAQRGVSLYLNAIQIVKFVEFTDDAGFDEQEDIEGGFEGVDTEFDSVTSEDEANNEAQPRL